MITKALVYAMEKHAGQMYSDGIPYITHPIRVAFKVIETQSIYTVVVALLHDVVEDTDATGVDIERGFGYLVAQSVAALTRKPTITYKNYIRFLSRYPRARIVKIADIEDNLFHCLRDGDKESLVKRYAWALTYLQNEV